MGKVVRDHTSIRVFIPHDRRGDYGRVSSRSDFSSEGRENTASRPFTKSLLSRVIVVT